jgi:pimeloyl-ACP methyl ester carboxylesterase
LTDFVLVHGGWHGAWCWRRVAPLLEARGHRALAPDLPGHGDDRTPVAALSLQAYADRVGEALSACAAPAVLVGHSLGGMVIAQAAADRPDRVALVAHVAAFLPGDGQSLADLLRDETESLLRPHCTLDPTGTLLVLDDAGLRPALYADCPAEDVALARERVRPEPFAPLGEPLRDPQGRLARLPHAYVECLDDRALPLARQRLMRAARPCADVLSLPSGHSPFFSMPEPLVEYLARLGTR